MTSKDRLQKLGLDLRELWEGRWFDRTRNVQTTGDVDLVSSGLPPDQLADSEAYMPASPHHIRQALRELPVTDPRTYTFVDLGSGKGRALFVAAELPFRHIIGVELHPALAAQAEANLRRFRPRRPDPPPITTLHGDARDFVCPHGDLVLFLFHPFGAETLTLVLDQLDLQRRLQPGHLIVILLWPQHSRVIAARDGMRLVTRRREYQIFAAPPL